MRTILTNAGADIDQEVPGRTDEGSRLRRLDPDQLQEWLERYRFGELWRMGEIGGTRC